MIRFRILDTEKANIFSPSFTTHYTQVRNTQTETQRLISFGSFIILLKASLVQYIQHTQEVKITVNIKNNNSFFVSQKVNGS